MNHDITSPLEENNMKYEPVYYGDYLQLDKILNAQSLQSEKYGKAAHDEMLFIIIHQTYELWFKQILFEIESIQDVFDQGSVPPSLLSKGVARLNRITEIQRVLNDQMNIIETMSSLDFMEFRDYLVPASGFQSLQFRLVETKLGLKPEHRTENEKKFFNSRLSDKDKVVLENEYKRKSIFELLEEWLERMPFAETEGYNFWEDFLAVVNNMLKSDKEIIEQNLTLGEKQKNLELMNLQGTFQNFQNLFDEAKYQELIDKKLVKLSRKAKLNAIFIMLFKDEPILQMPYQLLVKLIDVDELFTAWRYRHSIMANRILGSKIGTGGSSGHEYLKNSTENNRIFKDLFALATYLIPESKIPKLPEELREKLNFIFEK